MQYIFKDCRVIQKPVSLQKQNDNDMQSAKQAVIPDLLIFDSALSLSFISILTGYPTATTVR